MDTYIPHRKRATTFRRAGWLAVASMVAMSLVGPGAAGVAAAGAAPAVDPACGTVPLDVEIILDNSGSMTSNSDVGQTRAQWAQTAINQLIGQLDSHGVVGTGPAADTGGRHRVGLTTFAGDSASVLSPLGSHDALGTEGYVPSVGAGNTPFKQGMAAGATDLTTGNHRTMDFGQTVRHIIIFLSDGRPWPDTNARRPNSTEIATFQAAADEVFSIAIGQPGGSGANAIDLGLMQLLAKPLADHYANIVSASGLPAFFENIFQTIACTGSLQVTKTVSDGTNFPGGTFGFHVDCGTAGTFDPSIILAAGGTPASTTVSGIKDGASCTVSENTPLPPAGTGWAWGTPVITPNPAPIVAGQTVTVTVNNPRTSSPAPHLSIAKSVTETGYSKVTDVLHYTIVATNDGNTTLTAVTVSDPSVSGLSCTPANGSSLAPNVSMSCTATHTVTQADLDAGHYANTACVNAPTAAQACASKDIPGTGTKSISLTKSASPTTYSAVNDVITYTYVIKNTGNVTIGPAQFTVTDDHINSGTAFNCGGATTTLAPNATVTCTNTYTITQANLDAGQVMNYAVAHGAGLDSLEAQARVTADQTRTISLTKDPSPTTYSAVNDVITYTYVIKNTGNVTIGPAQFTVTDDHIAGGAFSCGAAATTLAPNATVTCTNRYTIAQADLDAGSVKNTATAHGAGLDSNQAQATVNAVQGPKLDLVKSADPATYDHVGQAISYSYLLTNTGNVTLSGSFTVTDNKATVTCPDTASLAHGVSITCTATYTITQPDLNNGSVTNTATGHGFFGKTPVDSNVAHATVTVVVRPAIAIAKTANPTSLTFGGGSVTYTYVVTNPGNVPLYPVTVSDVISGTSTMACTPAGLVMTGGNTDSKLDPGETWTYTCTKIVATTTSNTATATGHYGDQSVTATASATVTVGTTPNNPTPTPSPSASPSPSPTGAVGGATGKPHVTPPPTDALGGTTGQPVGDTWRLILLALAGLLASILLLTPASPARARRRR